MTRSSIRQNRVLRLLSVVALIGILGASPVFAQDVKVGFVNVAKVLDESPQAASARERIEKEFAPRDRALLAQQKELRALEDQLVRDRTVMTEDQRVNLEQDIRTRRREMRRTQEEFREELNLRRNQELSKLQRRVIEVIQELAKAEAYDLVVTADGVVYAGERVDITEKVVGRLKETTE